MSNHGNFIGSLGAITRWLGARAEALGVEIYPGFAATELLYGDKEEVVGIATGDMGVGRDGHPKAGFTRGMELFGKYVLLAEGARGSLSKQAIARYGLDSESGPQKYGIGLKELWQVSDEHFSSGLVQHTFGWPLSKGRERRLVSSIITATDWFRSDLWSISTTRIRRSLPSTNFSALRPIR